MSKKITFNKLANIISSSSKFKSQAKKQAIKKFEKEKAKMIAEFDNHPVTKEIKAGPNQSVLNSSGTLGGKGNLFSFIGFESNQDPIGPVVSVLNSKTKLIQNNPSVRLEGKKITLEFNVKTPTEQEITSVSKLPFESGRSWVLGIQAGISGLGFYLRKLWNSSRSGTAIQANNKVRSASFKNIPYLGAILNNFKNNLK